MDKFWVGGTGNWTDTAHWSDTSGGAGGAAVPTISDRAVFDANSGTAGFTVSASGNTNVGGIDAMACPYSGCVLAYTGGRSQALSVVGDAMMPANFKLSYSNFAVNLRPAGAVALVGVASLEGTVGINLGGSAGTVRLTAPLSAPGLTILGNLDTNGQDITLTGTFSVSAGAVQHAASKISASSASLSNGTYASTGGWFEITSGDITLGAGQYVDDVRLVGTGTQVVHAGAGSSIGYLTRWLPSGGVSPALAFDFAGAVTITKKLTVHGAPDARIFISSIGASPASLNIAVSAKLASFNECNPGNITLAGDAAPAIVSGGDPATGYAPLGFLFPPAALLPLFAAGLA